MLNLILFIFRLKDWLLSAARKFLLRHYYTSAEMTGDDAIETVKNEILLHAELTFINMPLRLDSYSLASLYMDLYILDTHPYNTLFSFLFAKSLLCFVIHCYYFVICSEMFIIVIALYMFFFNSYFNLQH